MMTSKSPLLKTNDKDAFVWIWLPDTTEAVVAGNRLGRTRLGRTRLGTTDTKKPHPMGEALFNIAVTCSARPSDGTQRLPPVL